MRSEIKEDYLVASLSRGVWWRGPPLVWRTREVPSSVLVQISNSLLYLHAFHVHLFIACHVLLFIMLMPCDLV